MRKLILPVLLLSSSLAVAGGAGQPAPVSQTLRLTAPVGTVVTYQTMTTTKTNISDLTVTARPGAEVDQATLDRTREEFRAGLSKGLAAAVPEEPGQATYRVAGRDAAGNVTLQTATTMNAGPAGDITIQITLRVSPSGQQQATALKVESANPEVQALFGQLGPEQLNGLSGQGGGTGVPNAYGMRLIPGQTRNATNTADVQGFFGGLLGGLPGAGNLDFKSSPARSLETTTYNGLNAQGLYAFTGRSRLEPWTFSVTVPGLEGRLTLEVPSSTSQTEQLYRRDGLLASLVTTTTTQMRMTVPVEDQVITLTMDLQQQMTLRQK